MMDVKAGNIGELMHYSITRFVRPREEELITRLISIGRYSKMYCPSQKTVLL